MTAPGSHARPRSPLTVALAALAVALLAGLLWWWLSRPAPPAPTQFRVASQASPVDTALWFVDRYPQYFLSGEDQLGAYLDELDPRDREYVLAQAQTLVWAWVEHELAAIPSRDPSALINAAGVAVRRETLNQLEYNVSRGNDPSLPELDTYTGDPLFGAGVFARLVRGGTNCEGQNHLVAVLIEAGLAPAPDWGPAFEAKLVGVPRHVLVATEGPGLDQPLFVDAWSNLSAFTLSEREPAPLIPGLPGRALRPTEEYAAAEGQRIELEPGRHAPTKAVDLPIHAPSLDDARLDRIDDPWRLYLYARVLDLYDDPRAPRLYRRIRDRHCETWADRHTFVCAASILFLARLTALPPA